MFKTEAPPSADRDLDGDVRTFETMFGITYTGNVCLRNSLPNMAHHAGLMLNFPLDARIIHHELGHWLHCNDPGINANLYRFHSLLEQQFNRYVLNRADQRLFHELLDETYSQQRYQFVTRNGTRMNYPEILRQQWVVTGGDP